MLLWPQVEKILPRVQKPARYAGAEIGSVGPEGADCAAASIVLAFPDLYEIGASYHGYRVLYERINDHPRFRAERAFAPWIDFERRLREAAIPLHTIETFRPVRAFDVIGFTLQHELNYTNVLNMLDLAGLPVRSADRGDPWPLVVAGGEGALAPAVMAPFIDAFVLGDGEEVVLEILERVAELKQRPSVVRTDCLASLSKIDGVYVPSQAEMEFVTDAVTSAKHSPSIEKTKESGTTSGMGVPPMVPCRKDMDVTASGETQNMSEASHRQDADATVDATVDATIVIKQGAYLPHWTRERGTYAVTFRLIDSLPEHILKAWHSERDEIVKRAQQLNRPLSEDEKRRLQRLYSEKVERYLDAGHGACWLKREEIANLVAGALHHFNGVRYQLLAWCIMPNHVHVVFEPLQGHDLSQILHSWKSYTAKAANKLLGREGAFWQQESYDHLVRDENDLLRQVNYTLANPDKAGLKEWQWRSSGMGVPPMVPCRKDMDQAIPAEGHTASDTNHRQDADATISGETQNTSEAGHRQDADATFRRRYFDLASDRRPVRPVVPLARIVHDRLVVEIRRGCTRGCRFCSAGMTTRPVRERPVDQIVDIVEHSLAVTGYRDVSLLSLSTGDYSQILPLVRALTRRFSDRMVSIALPSLRISTFDVALAEEINEMRKTGFTFAPEAGTERLRRVINKPLADEQFDEVVDAVCRAGWRTLKFYFMVGLPTETDDDLDGIVRVVRRAEQIGRSYWKRKLAINVTLSPFVPKPHTPFQWEAQVERTELERRYRRVAAALGRSRCVKVKRHSVDSAFVEAVLARGDRRVADAVERAWRRGCRLDAWSDQFGIETWMEAFDEADLDPTWYANRTRRDDERLPWDPIGAGPSKEFLLRQRDAAREGELIEDCTSGPCPVCGACDEDVKHNLADDSADGQSAAPLPRPAGRDADQPQRARGRRRPDNAQPPRAAVEQPPPVQRVRLSYSKAGRLRFLSHLDMVKTWQLLVERAGLPVAYSRGFHPVALLQYSPPLPVGHEARAEWVDLFLRERLAPEAIARRLDDAAPDGMRVFAPVEVDVRAPALDRSVIAAEYEIELSKEFNASHGVSPEEIAQRWRDARRESAPPDESREEQRKRPAGRAAAQIKTLEVLSNDPGRIRMRVVRSEGNLTAPLRLLNDLLGIEIGPGDGAGVTRLGLVAPAPVSPVRHAPPPAGRTRSRRRSYGGLRRPAS